MSPRSYIETNSLQADLETLRQCEGYDFAAIGFEERLKYPILLSENLTSLIAIPLWFENELWGVLLLGQRQNKPLPDNFDKVNIQGKLSVFSEGW